MIGLGTTFEIGSATIGNIVSITPPSGERGKVDITNMDSTQKEYLAGLVDYGDAEIMVLYDATTAATLAAKLAPDAEAEEMVITYPDGATHSWTGYVSGIEWECPVEDKMTTKIKVTVGEDLVFAAAT